MWEVVQAESDKYYKYYNSNIVENTLKVLINTPLNAKLTIIPIAHSKS